MPIGYKEETAALGQLTKRMQAWQCNSDCALARADDCALARADVAFTSGSMGMNGTGTNSTVSQFSAGSVPNGHELVRRYGYREDEVASNSSLSDGSASTEEDYQLAAVADRFATANTTDLVVLGFDYYKGQVLLGLRHGPVTNRVSVDINEAAKLCIGDIYPQGHGTGAPDLVQSNSNDYVNVAEAAATADAFDAALTNMMQCKVLLQNASETINTRRNAVYSNLTAFDYPAHGTMSAALLRASIRLGFVLEDITRAEAPMTALRVEGKTDVWVFNPQNKYNQYMYLDITDEVSIANLHKIIGEAILKLMMATPEDYYDESLVATIKSSPPTLDSESFGIRVNFVRGSVQKAQLELVEARTQSKLPIAAIENPAETIVDLSISAVYNAYKVKTVFTRDCTQHPSNAGMMTLACLLESNTPITFQIWTTHLAADMDNFPNDQPNVTYELKAGSFILFPAKLPHRVQAPASNYRVIFSGYGEF